ncbi:MAG: PEP-CTERM-box response regulator transcription factor [Verrucomicrobiota bacterium]|jgi:two-component system, NtrC family, response regulator
MKQKLLIIDDDDEIQLQLKWALATEYDVALVHDRAGALAAFQSMRPQVILLDLGLPPTPNSAEEGFATLAELLRLDRFVKIIIVTGQSEKENALRAIGEGAYDFISKPLQLDELRIILQRAFHVGRLEHEYHEVRNQIAIANFEGMLGTSPQMQEVFLTIRKVALTEVPVLILGESGTGKEMAAQAIHRLSSRRDGPFIAINCGAIPEALLESELFGHEKGAFTGAHVQRMGRVETAGSGTLFLDEIGELPLSLQVKLLRFLQDHCIQRVGGRKDIFVDARVVAATNSDLKKATNEGRFREDLYYRLAVVQIKLPPLRDRPRDIPLLAQTFLTRFASESGKHAGRFSQTAVRAMERHPWPGNVRELQNRVRRAVIMAEGARVTETDLELEVEPGGFPGRTLREAREALERELVQNSLRRHSGNVTQAAHDLGISRPTLYELMDKLGLRKVSADPDPQTTSGSRLVES